MIKNYANENTPTVSSSWQNLTSEQRIKNLINITKDNEQFLLIEPKRALDNGQIFVELKEAIPAGKRGMLLLDYEEFLKNNLEVGINVWCEPIGDKNSLRNLRGIQLKS